MIAEANYLATTDTANAGGSGKAYPYNSMDKDGKLYYNGEPALDKNGRQRVLYKQSELPAFGLCFSHSIYCSPARYKAPVLYARKFRR